MQVFLGISSDLAPIAIPKEVQEERIKGDAELMTLTWLRSTVSLKSVMGKIWITVVPRMEAWSMASTPMTMTTG